MKERLPRFPAVLQVYAVIAVMFAGWTITSFLWKLSAWLLLLNLGEIFTIFSYAMAVNFVESLLVLLALLIAGALLPAYILREDFVVRGTILSIGLVGALMAFVGAEMQFDIESGFRLLIAPFAVLLLMALSLHLSSRSPVVRSATEWVSDHMVIFLFILMPFFVLLSLYVTIRNVL
jgi:hypothetical protein